MTGSYHFYVANNVEEVRSRRILDPPGKWHQEFLPPVDCLNFHELNIECHFKIICFHHKLNAQYAIGKAVLVSGLFKFSIYFYFHSVIESVTTHCDSSQEMHCLQGVGWGGGHAT